MATHAAPTRQPFGARGYLLASGLLATVVVGWFAVQTGLVADSLNQAFGSSLLLFSVISGLLFTAVTLQRRHDPAPQLGEVLVGFVSAAPGYVALVALAPGLARSSGASFVTEGDAP